MGPRQNEDPRQVADRSFFLRTHLQRLSELEHRLDQITVVLATGGEAPHEAYALALTELDGTPVVVLPRENQCYSYGSWEHAFLTFGDAFTHYVLIEDDYIPCFDRFDEHLLEIVERKKTYVCSLQAWEKTHAAISNSIASSPLLHDVLSSSFVAGAQGHPRPTDGFYSQLMWSKWFYDNNYVIEDWTDTNASPFWNGHEIRWYGHPSFPPLFVPIQALGREISIADGWTRRLNVTMMSNGDVVPLQPNDKAMWDECLACSLDDGRWAFPPMLSKPFYWDKTD
jgi:hypothetical protein